MISYWGVDHGEDVSKTSLERHKTNAALFGAPFGALGGAGHGAYTAKKGKKGKSALVQGGSTLAGGVGGVAAGGLTRNPIVAQVGGIAGSTAGSVYGANRNFRKGRVKGS